MLIDKDSNMRMIYLFVGLVVARIEAFDHNSKQSRYHNNLHIVKVVDYDNWVLNLVGCSSLIGFGNLLNMTVDHFEFLGDGHFFC